MADEEPARKISYTTNLTPGDISLIKGLSQRTGRPQAALVREALCDLFAKYDATPS